jgi:hypothetical protein
MTTLPSSGDGQSHLIASFVVAPRERVGARPPHSIRLPASGIPEAPEGFYFPRVKVSGAGLTDRKTLAPEPFLQHGGKSPLAWHRTAGSSLLPSRPIPVGRNFMPWDCKLTPADCACQEGNTTGCIPSNDGLDAGLRSRFPHGRKQRAVAIGWAWAKIPVLGRYVAARVEVGGDSFGPFWGSADSPGANFGSRALDWLGAGRGP